MIKNKSGHNIEVLIVQKLPTALYVLASRDADLLSTQSAIQVSAPKVKVEILEMISRSTQTGSSLNTELNPNNVLQKYLPFC